LVGERVAQEAVRRETRELEQSNRLRESRIDDRRIPRRRARDRPASLGCLRTRGNPIRIRRRRARAVGPCGRQSDANTGGGSLFQERAAVEDMTRAALGGHLALLLYGTGRNERLQSPRVPRTMPSNDGKVKHRFCRSQRTGETGLSSCLPRKPPDLERAFATMARERVAGLIVPREGIFISCRHQFAEFSAKSRLSVLYPGRDLLR